MKTFFSTRLLALCALLAGWTGAWAQQMPQDFWYPSDFWQDKNHASYPPISAVLSVAHDHDGNLWVYDQSNNGVFWKLDNFGNRTKQHIQNYQHGKGGFVVGSTNILAMITAFSDTSTLHFRHRETFALKASVNIGNKVDAGGLVAGRDDNVYLLTKVQNSTDRLIRVFNHNGALLRSWSNDPAFPVESSIIGCQGMAMGLDGLLHVSNGSKMLLYTTNGSYQGSFPITGFGGGGFIYGPDGLVYYTTSQEWRVVNPKTGTSIAIPNRAPQWSATQTSAFANGLSVGNDGKVYVGFSNFQSPSGVGIFERAYRTIGGSPMNRPPVPSVTGIRQRYGTSFLDIDYRIFDPDNSIVTTAAVAFRDGAQSLDKLVTMRTFVEGTGATLGAGIVTNTTHRLTWDAAADFSTNFVNLGVTVLAKDDRDLLGLHFLTIPASGTNSTLTINRSPVTQAELMPLWYWLTATDTLSGAVLSNGVIYATSWVAPPAVTNGPPGLIADYYDNSNFTGTTVQRVDSLINFSSGSAWQPAGIAGTTFSVRWQGKFQSNKSETINFYTETDDGVRLYINNTLVIDKWIGQGMTEWSGAFPVLAGRIYEIKLEYYQDAQGYGAILRWSSPSMAKQVVPASRLFNFNAISYPIPLAADTYTSKAGRFYLWEMLGLRDATSAEILRAKEAGHPGLINRFDPRVKVGSHPEKVNEYGFDTGTSWPFDTYFVVPVP